MGSVERTILQPLHPAIRPKLDPEYVQFHDEVLQFVVPSESIPWDPSSRLLPSPMAKTQMRSVEIGSVVDKGIGRCRVRIFTPEGPPPDNGWPLLCWYHGGGWVNGGLGSENGFLKHICKYLGVVVVSINYRHAPEHVYPAAINDAFDGFRWLIEEKRKEDLHIDHSRVAIGGLSAGGQLAASVALKAADAALPIQPKFQMLLCPVIDSTTSWPESQHSPWLTPSRMGWYRSLYFSDPASTSSWDASPNYAPQSLLAQMPPTFMAISDCDLLAPEDVDFAAKLEKAGVKIEKVVYEGCTHSILMLAGIHKAGKRFVHDACKMLANGLGLDYVEDDAPVLPMA